MRNFKEGNINTLPTGESPEYLRGYRDGIRDRRVGTHATSGDGLLGALLAIALILGLGYFSYNYATTGRFLPDGVEIHPLKSQFTNPHL